MDGTAYEEFFTNPTHPYHRRYEALRAIFVEGRSQKEVAEEFGFAYSSMRQLAYEFRLYCDAESQPDASSPFFAISHVDVPPPRPTTRQKSQQ